mmetsp:Transcript_62525/g.173293  ORF Transcript_62525/g.173293 Transcript_62525/m.173293 type:complete len:238 (-) Transcript_62525:8-721(-)
MGGSLGAGVFPSPRGHCVLFTRAPQASSGTHTRNALHAERERRRRRGGPDASPGGAPSALRTGPQHHLNGLLRGGPAKVVAALLRCDQIRRRHLQKRRSADTRGDRYLPTHGGLWRHVQRSRGVPRVRRHPAVAAGPLPRGRRRDPRPRRRGPLARLAPTAQGPRTEPLELRQAEGAEGLHPQGQREVLAQEVRAPCRWDSLLSVVPLTSSELGGASLCAASGITLDHSEVQGLSIV